jgi:anaphase-promoting complex subunit 5
MQNREKPFYQYALLNLAILQADFGCYQEAVAAIHETISTAREKKDMICLNFSLSWLYHFGKAHPKVMSEADKTGMLEVEREGLAFLRAKTKESGMSTLWSSSLLSEARMGLSGGESVATAFENILRSSHLTVTGNMMSDVGVQMMLQSSLWSRLGIAHLAWLNYEVFLRCHSQAAPFEDILKYTCRAAYFLTQRGRYDEAMESLEWLDANARRALKANRYWLLFRGLVQLKRDIHRNNLDGADQLLAQLLQSHDGDPDLSFEFNTLHIDTMMRRGDYGNALAKIENLSMEVADAGQDIFFRVKLLVMKAVLFERCGRPQKGFSVAVRAASIAWRARLLPVLWEAMAAIASILISLEEFEAASRILASVTPRALECEDCALAARLFSSLVDAHMGMAGQAGPGSSKRTENLTTALDFVDRAFAEYSSIEDVKKQCEMMAKKATIMQVMGDPVLANDYAAAYLDIKRERCQL